jgi:hypothetical protein
MMRQQLRLRGQGERTQQSNDRGLMKWRHA